MNLWSRSCQLPTPRASYVFKKQYSWEEIPLFNARLNEAIDDGCNWNDGDVSKYELETVLHREASSAVAIYCFRPQKTVFLGRLIEHTFIDITQLECPPLAEILVRAINCRFACHNRSKHICVLRRPIH
jgi:hypothetical protein